MNQTLEIERDRPRPVRPSGRLDAVAVAVFAGLVSAAGAARPSLWFDEAATISAATRPLPDLWRLLHHIDAVHGLYYLLMHGWFTVFPVTEFWLRWSSSVAVAGAAAGVVVLGRQFSGRTAAVTAGLVFAMLPRTTWAGAEGRSYALTMLAAVWVTVLLVAALRGRRRTPWAGYAAALIGCALLNVFLVLLVVVHAVVLAVSSPRRPTVSVWLGAVGAALLAVIPFLIYSRAQIAQVGWISPLHRGTVGEVVVEQYFDHSAAFAMVAGCTLAAPLLLRRFGGLADGERRLVVVCAAWIVLPTLALLVGTVVSEPVYYPRYLSFTAPAMALLLGVCITAVTVRRTRITVWLLVFAVAAAPNHLFGQRGPYAKEGMDFSQVADVITAQARPGDCLVLDNTTDWQPGPIRPLTAARPAAYADLVDPGRGRRAAERGRLWDAHLGVWGVADRFRSCTVLWTVSERDPQVPGRQSGEDLEPGPRLAAAPAYRVPARMGFRLVERWQFNFAQVTKSTR